MTHLANVSFFVWILLFSSNRFKYFSWIGLATDFCLCYEAADHPKPLFFSFLLICCQDGLKHVEEIKFNKCIYIEDACLERLSSVESLQESLVTMEVVSCGNVTDKGIIALHRLRSVQWLNG